MNAPVILDERHQIGANNPPADPFGAVKAHVEDLLTEARAWCDGQAIADQAQADTLSRLLDDLRKAEKAADAQRRVEAKVFDDGKAEVQARYKPLLTSAERAIDACKAALGTWLAKVEAEKRAVAEAARQEAANKAALAVSALRNTSADDLEGREAAEQLVTEAKEADKAASRAEKDKAHATGGERAVGLRSYWIPTLTDGVVAARHYWNTDRPAVEAFILSLAERDVRCGKRQIPGVDVREERRAV